MYTTFSSTKNMHKNLSHRLSSSPIQPPSTSPLRTKNPCPTLLSISTLAPSPALLTLRIIRRTNTHTLKPSSAGCAARIPIPATLSILRNRAPRGPTTRSRRRRRPNTRFQRRRSTSTSTSCSTPTPRPTPAPTTIRRSGLQRTGLLSRSIRTALGAGGLDGAARYNSRARVGVGGQHLVDVDQDARVRCFVGAGQLYGCWGGGAGAGDCYLVCCLRKGGLVGDF